MTDFNSPLGICLPGLIAYGVCCFVLCVTCSPGNRTAASSVCGFFFCFFFFVCHVQSRQGYGCQECAVLFLTCAQMSKRALAQTLGASLA